MIRGVTPAVALLLISASAAAQPLSPRNANYTIEARLDPAARTITATETVVWRNITETTTAELQFHVYWNAWKDMKSTWLRELALSGPDPAAGRRAGDGAKVDVTAIRLIAPTTADLTTAQHFIAPDDGNSDDATVSIIVPIV